MEPLIYYPTFEPPSESWLRFALLYFENFKPIVPYNRRDLLSPQFRRIIDSTDLISLYAPEYDEGYRASLNAIEETNKILQAPHSRSYLFNKVNVIRAWRNPQTWRFKVYQEKFSHDWLTFCEREGIGRMENDGLLLPEELAFLFMSYLAKEIAFREGAAIITDNNRFDNFTNMSRAASPNLDKRMRFAKGIFNLLIPSNLNRLSIPQLINFRNRNRELISEFNRQLDIIQTRISDGYSERDFIEDYNRVYSEISAAVINLGLGIASIPFAAYILVTSQAATTSEYAKEILGALGIILGGGYALNKGLCDSRSRRYCKKYLTNLKRIES